MLAYLLSRRVRDRFRLLADPQRQLTSRAERR
jgi:hypothetical protein